MTRTRLTLAAALLAAGLFASLSVYALSDSDEPPEQAAALDAIDIEEIHAQVERALERVPWEEIGHQLADVRVALDAIDPEAIRTEVEAAMADIDFEEIQAEVRESLEDIDWDEIRRDIEDAQAEIETMDLEGVREEVLEALEDVDWDEIRRALEDARGIAAEELEALDEIFAELGSGSSGVI